LLLVVTVTFTFVLFTLLLFVGPVRYVGSFVYVCCWRRWFVADALRLLVFRWYLFVVVRCGLRGCVVPFGRLVVRCVYVRSLRVCVTFALFRSLPVCSFVVRCFRSLPVYVRHVVDVLLLLFPVDRRCCSLFVTLLTVRLFSRSFALLRCSLLVCFCSLFPFGLYVVGRLI